MSFKSTHLWWHADFITRSFHLDLFFPARNEVILPRIRMAYLGSALHGHFWNVDVFKLAASWTPLKAVSKSKSLCCHESVGLVNVELGTHPLMLHSFNAGKLRRYFNITWQMPIDFVASLISNHAWSSEKRHGVQLREYVSKKSESYDTWDFDLSSRLCSHEYDILQTLNTLVSVLVRLHRSVFLVGFAITSQTSAF